MRERMVCHAETCSSGNIFHKNSEIVELPSGDLFGAWFANPHDGRGEFHRETNLYCSRLPSGADHWENSRTLVDVVGRAVQPPVLFHGPDGYLWLLYTQLYGDISTSKIFLKRSGDGGTTWTDSELFYERGGLYLKNPPVHAVEEDWWVLGVDVGHSSQNKPGFLIIQDDYTDRPSDFPLLVGGDQISPNDVAFMSGHQGLRYPTPIQLSDGRLRAYMRPVPGGRLWATHSTNDGLTWTAAEETDIPNPNSGFDVHRTYAGNLVLINNPVDDTIPEGRNELAVFLSEDDGETWPYQFYLEREEVESKLAEQDPVGRPDFTYGSITQGNDEAIHTMYEYRRSGIKHVRLTEAEIRELGSGEPIVEAMAASSEE